MTFSSWKLKQSKKSLFLGLVGLILLLPGLASTHPLGNYSLNHYTAIELHPGELITQHVLDFAEIPSFNELANLDTSGDNQVSAEEMQAYSNSIQERFLQEYTFSIAGSDAEWEKIDPELIHHEVILSQGQGALTCLQLRFTCALHAPSLQKTGSLQFSFADNNQTHIPGIREIRILLHPGSALQQDDIRAQGPIAPVPLNDHLFFVKSLDVNFAFSLLKQRDPSAERILSDILMLMDPRSIPQFLLKPDESGSYKILKSPIEPDPEVQKQISILQPRNVISATGILSNPPTSANSSAEEIASDSTYSRSGEHEERWAALIGEDNLSPGIILFAIFVSIIAGATHAISPGHGKTVVAAYLVGSRGTLWHAIFLGIIVTLTHVSSVLILGFITLYFYQHVVPGTLNPIIESVSGLLIVMIGIVIFFRRYGAYQRRNAVKLQGVSAAHAHAHPHDSHGAHSHEHSHAHTHPHPHPHDLDHSHKHAHEHPHEHAHPHPHTHSEEWLNHEHGPHSHTHEIPADATWKDLLVLGITGGIVPCPAALLVLLSAIALHRLLFGMLLIVFFSIGLALVLITIGVLMVSAKQLLDRFAKSEDSLAWLQIVSPILVTLLGMVILLRGLLTGGYISINF